MPRCYYLSWGPALFTEIVDISATIMTQVKTKATISSRALDNQQSLEKSIQVVIDTFI